MATASIHNANNHPMIWAAQLSLVRFRVKSEISPLPRNLPTNKEFSWAEVWHAIRKRSKGLETVLIWWELVDNFFSFNNIHEKAGKAFQMRSQKIQLFHPLLLLHALPDGLHDGTAERFVLDAKEKKYMGLWAKSVTSGIRGSEN
jgi:hypothetical protein